MAESGEIEIVRDLIDEPDDSNGWSDEKIGGYIDRFTNLSKAAGNIWLAKAGSYAKLVDVTESGSSRKMSSLHKNALTMSKVYLDQAASEEEAEQTLPGPFSVPIVRRAR